VGDPWPQSQVRHQRAPAATPTCPEDGDNFGLILKDKHGSKYITGNGEEHWPYSVGCKVSLHENGKLIGAGRVEAIDPDSYVGEVRVAEGNIVVKIVSLSAGIDPHAKLPNFHADCKTLQEAMDNGVIWETGPGYAIPDALHETFGPDSRYCHCFDITDAQQVLEDEELRDEAVQGEVLAAPSPGYSYQSDDQPTGSFAQRVLGDSLVTSYDAQGLVEAITCAEPCTPSSSCRGLGGAASAHCSCCLGAHPGGKHGRFSAGRRKCEDWVCLSWVYGVVGAHIQGARLHKVVGGHRKDTLVA
jgi:hypothetical protein